MKKSLTFVHVWNKLLANVWNINGTWEKWLTSDWFFLPDLGGFPKRARRPEPAEPFRPCHQAPTACTQPNGMTRTKKDPTTPKKALHSQSRPSMPHHAHHPPPRCLRSNLSFKDQPWTSISSNSSAMFPWLWLCYSVIPCLKEGLNCNNSIPHCLK